MSYSSNMSENLCGKLPEALFLEDFEGNIIDVNSEACEILGYSREDGSRKKETS